MATRALLPNIQLANSRVKQQPRAETQKESEYRNAIQNIAATLGVIGQGVNIARATEPWWASLGYEGAPTNAQDAKADQLSAQLEAAYRQQAPQQQAQLGGAPQAQQAMQQQPQGKRMGPSMMDAAGRRGAVQDIVGGVTAKQAPQENAPTGPRFNITQSNKQEQRLVRNAPQDLQQGASVFRKEGFVTTPPAPQDQPSPWVPQQSAYSGERPSMQGVDQAIGSLKLPSEQDVIAQANADYKQREQARRQGWGYAQKAAQQNIAAEQAGIDKMAENLGGVVSGQIPQAESAPVATLQPPPPPPENPVERQSELLNIARETADPAALVAAEIDRYSAVPVYNTFAEAQAAMAQAVLDNDVDKAKLILQGAARSPFVDVRPTTLSDRLSGAHVRRAMKELTDMSGGMVRVQQAANAAAVRGDLAERRLQLDMEKAASIAAHRAMQEQQAQRRIEQTQQRITAQVKNIESMIDSRDVNDDLKKEFQKFKIALARGKTAQAYAQANYLSKMLPIRSRAAIVDLANNIGDLERGYREAGGAEAGYGEAPTLENLPGKIERGEAIAPKKIGVEAGTVDVYERKKSTDLASEQVKQMFGLGGGSGQKADLTASDKARIQQFNNAVAKLKTDSKSRRTSAKAVDTVQRMAESLPPSVRESAKLAVQALRDQVERRKATNPGLDEGM